MKVQTHEKNEFCQVTAAEPKNMSKLPDLKSLFCRRPLIQHFSCCRSFFCANFFIILKDALFLLLNDISIEVLSNLYNNLVEAVKVSRFLRVTLTTSKDEVTRIKTIFELNQFTDV